MKDLRNFFYKMVIAINIYLPPKSDKIEKKFLFSVMIELKVSFLHKNRICMSGVIPDVSVQTFFHQSGPCYTDFPRQILWVDRIGN